MTARSYATLVIGSPAIAAKRGSDAPKGAVFAWRPNYTCRWHNVTNLRLETTFVVCECYILTVNLDDSFFAWRAAARSYNGFYM